MSIELIALPWRRRPPQRSSQLHSPQESLESRSAQRSAAMADAVDTLAGSINSMLMMRRSGMATASGISTSADRGRATMSRHRLFYFMELKEPRAACGLFPSLSWCCYRVEWRPGQKFQDTFLDVGDCVTEVWQDKFVLATDPGGIEVIRSIRSWTGSGRSVRPTAKPTLPSSAAVRLFGRGLHGGAHARPRLYGRRIGRPGPGRIGDDEYLKQLPAFLARPSLVQPSCRPSS